MKNSLSYFIARLHACCSVYQWSYLVSSVLVSSCPTKLYVLQLPNFYIYIRQLQFNVIITINISAILSW